MAVNKIAFWIKAPALVSLAFIGKSLVAFLALAAAIFLTLRDFNISLGLALSWALALAFIVLFVVSAIALRRKMGRW